jgi:hypothetical protein
LSLSSLNTLCLHFIPLPVSDVQKNGHFQESRENHEYTVDKIQTADIMTVVYQSRNLRHHCHLFMSSGLFNLDTAIGAWCKVVRLILLLAFDALLMC